MALGTRVGVFPTVGSPAARNLLVELRLARSGPIGHGGFCYFLPSVHFPLVHDGGWLRNNTQRRLLDSAFHHRGRNLAGVTSL